MGWILFLALLLIGVSGAAIDDSGTIPFVAAALAITVVAVVYYWDGVLKWCRKAGFDDGQVDEPRE